jgi:hypothetical protein
MFALGFYRFYAAVLCGAVAFLALKRAWWVWVMTSVVVRLAWFAAESAYGNLRVRRLFAKCEPDFRQQFGPYGIRIANLAETNSRVRRSLVEVFEPRIDRLRKTATQLELMDALFSAGARPEADEYLLHDLKLKYARKRLEKEQAA